MPLCSRRPQGNTERILAGEPDSREFRKGRAFVGEHRQRQIVVAKQLFAEMQVGVCPACTWSLRLLERLGR